MDLVRRTLEEARGAARSQGKDVGRGGRGRRAAQGRGRQPAPLVGAGSGLAGPADCSASVTSDVARSRGWSDGWPRERCSGAGRRWSASRSPPTRRRPRCNEGVLTVSAESTAWATQLRMVQAQLLAKIAAAVGDGVVTSLKIVGPAAPSWRKGRYHIAGRGPATRTDEAEFTPLAESRQNGR